MLDVTALETPLANDFPPFVGFTCGLGGDEPQFATFVVAAAQRAAAPARVSANEQMCTAVGARWLLKVAAPTYDRAILISVCSAA